MNFRKKRAVQAKQQQQHTGSSKNWISAFNISGALAAFDEHFVRVWLHRFPVFFAKQFE